MKLPGAEHAVVEISKLRDYCLNPQHPRGRHKARVIASALGFTAADSDVLRQALSDAAAQYDVKLGEKDDYGQRYMLDFPLTGPAGEALVRSNWIVLTGEDFPRLTSCYVL